MEFNEFIVKILESVRNELPDCEAEIRKVVKNNNVTLSGLTIKSKDINTAPTIYLEQFYESYQEGEDLDEVVNVILRLYEDSRLSEDYDLDFVEKYEEAKNHIYFKAVNQKLNKEYLSEVVFFPFRDLALVPYIMIDDDIFGNASVVIHNELFKLWNIDKDEFYSDVMYNMENNYEYEFRPIVDVLGAMADSFPREAFDEAGMHVLYSKNRIYSAALIAVDGVMEKIASKLDSDYYIIPSSVHELIIVTADGEDCEETINNIILEVNDTVVSGEDILADHLYCYRRGVGITL